MLSDGRLAADARPEALLDRVRGQVWEWVVEQPALRAVRERYPVTSATRRPEGVRVHAAAPQRPAEDATRAATHRTGPLIATSLSPRA